MRPVAGWIVLLAAAVGSILLAAPPAPKPEADPPEGFSAGRAMLHVERIAVRPHPWGTAANRLVRDYVRAGLERHGFEVRVERSHAGLPAPVENVVALKRGTDSTGLVVLCAHYDSVAAGPGAGDDGAAVGALLETARALSEAPSLRNDLLLLVTDGEEAGLLGAKAFTRADPLADAVSVVLNFEARGISGRSLMFETSPGNRDLVAHYAAVMGRPAACSLMTAFYRIMPRTTDFAIFRKADYAGLNFAFIGGAVHYHAPTDTPANLSPASVQHHGNAMLGLARRLGNADLRTLEHDEDATYFDVLGLAFVQYPLWLDWPLTGLCVLAILLVLWRARRRGTLDGRGFGYGAWTGVRILASCAIVAGAMGYVLLQGLAAHVSRGAEATTSDPWFFAAFACLFLAAATGWTAWAARRGHGHGVIAGVLALWGLVLVAATAFLPGASFLFLWPLVFALPAIDAALGARVPSWAAAPFLPLVVLGAPLGLLLLQGMGLTLAMVHAPIFGLFLGLPAAVLDRDGAGDARLLVGLPLLLAAAGVAVGVLQL
ncbi:MAG: M28 family peptidase [Planctomycetota bacterium]|nr:M28 family peptidase [Planctomycetota bacterium]